MKLCSCDWMLTSARRDAPDRNGLKKLASKLTLRLQLVAAERAQPLQRDVGALGHRARNLLQQRRELTRDLRGAEQRAFQPAPPGEIDDANRLTPHAEEPFGGKICRGCARQIRVWMSVPRSPPM